MTRQTFRLFSTLCFLCLAISMLTGCGDNDTIQNQSEIDEQTERGRIYSYNREGDLAENILALEIVGCGSEDEQGEYFFLGCYDVPEDGGDSENYYSFPLSENFTAEVNTLDNEGNYTLLTFDTPADFCDGVYPLMPEFSQGFPIRAYEWQFDETGEIIWLSAIMEESTAEDEPTDIRGRWYLVGGDAELWFYDGDDPTHETTVVYEYGSVTGTGDYSFDGEVVTFSIMADGEGYEEKTYSGTLDEEGDLWLDFPEEDSWYIPYERGDAWALYGAYRNSDSYVTIIINSDGTCTSEDFYGFVSEGVFTPCDDSTFIVEGIGGISGGQVFADGTFSIYDMEGVFYPATVIDSTD